MAGFSGRFAGVVNALLALGCGEVLGADFDVTSKSCEDAGGTKNIGGACEGPNIRLAAMYHHTCAIMHDDKVWCWGENSYGEVGDGTQEFRPNPVRVDVPPAAKITAGEGHTCVLTLEGEIYCWGNNVAGQCGVDPTPVDLNDPILPVTPPVRVEGLDGLPIDGITAGRAHTCARSGEDVYCWGLNNEGQVGDFKDANGALLLSVKPSKIPELDRVLDVQSIKAHNCALRSALPRMVCWGRNGRAQLGPAATGMSVSATPVPIELPDPAVTVATFGLTFDSSYAAGSDGLIYAWGYNHRGQLGIGSEELIVAEPTPVQYVDPPGEIVDHALRLFRTDGSHQCTEVSTPDAHAGARFLCWGGDDHGELGRGILPLIGEVFTVAQPAHAIPNDSYQLVFGEDHGCAVVPGNPHHIRCWGRGGLVGDGRVPETPGGEVRPSQLTAEPVQWLPEEP